MYTSALRYTDRFCILIVMCTHKYAPKVYIERYATRYTKMYTSQVHHLPPVYSVQIVHNKYALVYRVY